MQETQVNLNLDGKKAEKPESRFERRLKERKLAILNNHVETFFAERSKLGDPNGEEADKLYVKHRDEWMYQCDLFNKNKRKPFTLRHEAFKESVDYYYAKEKVESDKKASEKLEKDFKHWYRRANVWKTQFFRALQYWIVGKTLFLWFILIKKKGCINTTTLSLWKTYYLNKMTAA